MQAKTYLTIHAIPFEEVDVMQDANALAFLRERGHRTVPQIYVGDQLLFPGGNAELQSLTADQVRAKLETLG